MRTIIGVGILAAIAALGCATQYQPAQVSIPIQDPSAAFSCATAALNHAGYVVVDANKDAGFIKAERQHMGAFDSHRVDRVTISIFAEPNSPEKLIMRVVGVTWAETNSPTAGQDATANRVKNDVREIETRCRN
jgi:hypothetical protein